MRAVRARRRWLGGALAGAIAAVAVPAIGGATSTDPAGVPVTVTVATNHLLGTTINKQLIGVDGPGPGPASGGSGPGPEDATMAALGLAWVRTDVSFESSYDCSNGSWSSTDLDDRVSRIQAEGASPLLIVDYTPSCLAPESDVGPGDVNYEPPDIGTYNGVSDKTLWDNLVYTMAVHEIAEGVRAFEVWNEPDGTFWYGTLAAYLYLYQDTVTVLESAAAHEHVAIDVGGPALLFSDSSWLEPFLAYVAANNLPLDFISWHFYGDYPGVGPAYSVDGYEIPPDNSPPYWYNPALRAQTYGEQVEQVRAELAKYQAEDPALDNTKLWIDEWNVDAGYDPRMSGPYDAAFAAAVLSSVQSAGLDRMAFYDVDDYGALANFGLLTDEASGYTPKPVYYTFDYWHQMEPAELFVDTSVPLAVTEAGGGVGAVASTDGRGAVTVLLYDFTPYDPTGNDGTSTSSEAASIFSNEVTLALSGLAAKSYTVTEQLVDGSEPNSSSSSVTVEALQGSESLRFDMAQDAVALITLTPA